MIEIGGDDMRKIKVSVFIILAIILVFVSNICFAEEKKCDENNEKADIVAFRSSTGFNNYLRISSIKEQENSEIIIELKLFKDNISKCTHKTENLKIINLKRSEEKLIVHLKTQDIESNVEIVAVSNKGESIKTTCFLYSTQDKIFVSDISKELAFIQCLKFKIENGLINKKEYGALLEDYRGQNIRTIAKYKNTRSINNSENVTIEGHIYTASTDFNLLQIPVRSVKIEAFF